MDIQLGAMLHVYKGEWGLPTIDFECLRALCLLRFTRCPMDVETNANPLRSGAGKLPYLQIGNDKFVGYSQIKRVLDLEGYPIDAHLNTKQKHLSATYANWVFTNLHAYYHYFLYGEPFNFDKTTRGLYAKRTPFPFNFYYPSTYQREACDVVQVMASFDVNDKLDKHESDYLVLNAKKCVNLLSRKLGRKVWFFGDTYSEFDAIVYSYLAIIFKITLPNNPLQNHIKGSQNLVNFINRITKDIFRNEGFSSIKPTKTANGTDVNVTHSEHKFLESECSTKIIAGVGALLAMGAFAAWRGIYNQLTTRSSTDYDGIDYDDDDAEEGLE
ncbi:GL21498 [Drosophila persimilis]|uniref:Metaxin n=1 Tax=Drosophila persimilis TaxID=7234 RepID=B4GDS7_DROPE|nr:metaxin-1 homolog isoform X1 [Drosophila persimilis]EDW34588.1 GL21498 [Drosophila persimilis]